MTLAVDVVEGSPEGFARLMEIVPRRNVRLYNCGMVDERCLECGENRRPTWNLDSLSLGDIAPTDAEYWYRAYNLCGLYSDTLASWVDDGATPIS